MYKQYLWLMWRCCWDHLIHLWYAGNSTISTSINNRCNTRSYVVYVRPMCTETRTRRKGSFSIGGEIFFHFCEVLVSATMCLGYFCYCYHESCTYTQYLFLLFILRSIPAQWNKEKIRCVYKKEIAFNRCWLWIHLHSIELTYMLHINNSVWKAI